MLCKVNNLFHIKNLSLTQRDCDGCPRQFLLELYIKNLSLAQRDCDST